MRMHIGCIRIIPGCSRHSISNKAQQVSILKGNHNTSKIFKTHKYKLTECENIHSCNRLIERFCKSKMFLALCEEYQTLEERQADKAKSLENLDSNNDTADTT